MAGHTPWAEIKRKPMTAEAEARAERTFRAEMRRYNRPWWKLVRFYDRLRGRHRISKTA
jgi:hypothetical protein